MFDIACEHRKTITPQDVCVEFSFAQMSCPAGNTFEGRNVALESGGYPRIRCRVCGVGHLPVDSDSRPGFWNGQVTWGPNQFDSTLSESEIFSYRLYVVDSQYQKLGHAVAEQEVRLWATLQMTCCDTSMYKASVELELPQNSSYFMVVPVTLGGMELNVGPTSERIRDLGGEVAATGAACRRHHLFAAEISLLVLSLFSLSRL